MPAENSLTRPAPTVIPPVSWPEQKAAAAARRAAFPYRFPRDERRLGGSFSVDENKRRLLRYFYLERRLAQALGSWTLAVPEFEVKLEMGRHIFWHADAARRLRERLTEQEMGLKEIDAFRDGGIDSLIDEALSAENSAQMLAGIHLVIGRALQVAYRQHIEDTCPIADAPSVRLLRQLLLDYDSMLGWAEAAVAAYVSGGVDEQPITLWRWQLSQLLQSLGGVTGAGTPCLRPSPLKTDSQPYQRGVTPMRDSRFETFVNTGDYNVADGLPRYERKSYEDERLRFVRTQRDEVDAIEAFGTFLWDIRFRDFNAEYDLARITWDEARHTEIGHNALQVLGYDPYELPNRLTSSTCRGPMEPEYGFTEINMFGEVAVLKTIHSLIDESVQRGDSILTHISDFVRADERTHVRKGQGIMKHMTKMQWKDLELKTRELFTECLVNLGVITPDSDLFTISREDIEFLVGE